MAGRIAWQLEIQGLDQTLLKLRELDVLLGSVSRKGGMLGGGTGGVTGGAGRGTTIINGVPGVAGAAGGSTIGSGVAAGTAAGITSGSNYYSLRKDFQQFAGGRNIENEINTSLKKKFKLFEDDIKEATEKLRKQFSSGGLAKIFSSSGAGGMAKIIELFQKFAIEIAVVVAAFIVLKKSIQLLEEGIKHGAEAYQNAAKLGQGIGSAYQISSAFRSIGMEAPDLSLLQGQFNTKAQKFQVPGSEEVIGAARAGQFGNAQQLLNMAEEFKLAMKDAESSARQMEYAAKATEQLSIGGAAVSREWHTLLTQLAAYFSPIISNIMEASEYLLKGVNLYVEQLITVLKILHLIDPNTEFKKLGARAGGQGTTTGAWEKMGFIFPSASPEKTLESINKNTRETVTAINKLTAVFKDEKGKHGGSLMFPQHSLP